MPEKLRDVASVLTGRGQMNIYRRVLRMALIGSLATFFIMGVLAFYAMFRIRDTLDTQGDVMEEEAASHIEETTEEHIRRRLMETTQVRAQLINRELENVAMDAEYLSDELTAVLTHPESRAPRSLPNVSFEPVPEETPYIHFSADLLRRGLDALQHRQGPVETHAQRLHHRPRDARVRDPADVDHAALRQDAEAIARGCVHVDQLHG